MTETTDFNFAEDDFTAADIAKFELIKSEEEDLNNLAELLNQSVAAKLAKLSQEKDEFYSKQLASKELESDSFFNHAPCGYFSTSGNGIINKINDTLLVWLGYAKEDIIGKVTWQSLLSVGGKMYFETHYSPLLQMQGFVQEISFEMVKKDKTRLPILINTKQIRDENGKVQINYSTVFDVSQRKSYENELLIAKRTAEEQNKLINEINEKLLKSEEELKSKIEEVKTLNENLNKLVEHTFKNASIPIYFFLGDASIYNFNDIAAENLGYTSEELHTLKIYDLYKDYDEKKWASVWAKLKVNKKITIETQQKKKDGTLIDVIITANYVKFGELELNCSFVLDITEKKKVEQQLNLLDYSYKHTDSAMSFLDENGLFVDFNQATANMLGYSYEEFRGKTIMDINPMVTKEFWLNRWEDLKVTPNQKFEAKFKRKDGIFIDVAVSTNSIELNGKIVNFGFYEDITEKKKTTTKINSINELLQRQTNRLLLATKSAQLGIWDWDLENDSIIWDEGMCKLYGIAANEFKTIKEGWIARLHEEDRTDIENEIQLAITNKEEFNTEFRIKWSDSSIHNIRATGIVERADGKPKHLIGVSWDVTKEIEAALEKERMMEELLENNLDLKQFGFITTHNLRAPLTNLILISKLLSREKIENPSALKLIEGFKVSTEQLNETLNDLIKVLIVKEKTNLTLDQLSFEEIIDKVKESISKILSDNKVIIETDFSDVPTVHFTKIYLESIFLNLITNSIKYRHPERNVIVKIKTIKDAIGRTKLTFSDNGIGMDMSLVKHKIFGFHQRFHNNTDSKGVGLFLVKSQINALGGQIEVDSEVNVGTTFTIIFK